MEDNELVKILKDINKDEQIVKLGKDFPDLGKIPTGVLSLDKLTDGGWPLGRVVMLFGKYGSTKSTLALWAILNAQKMGKDCMYIDAENRFDSRWAAKIGVDISKLPVIRKRVLEDILDASKLLAPKCEVIVIDSISNVYVDKFFEDESGQIGGQARASKELLNKLINWNPDALIITISQQMMENQGQVWLAAPTGGNMVRHQASILLHLRYAKKDIATEGTISKNKIIEGGLKSVDIHWRCDKGTANQVGKQGIYRFLANGKPDEIYDVLAMGQICGVITRGGGWFHYGERKWQGLDKLLAALREDETLLKEVQDEIFRAVIDGGTEEGTGEDSGYETDYSEP